MIVVDASVLANALADDAHDGAVARRALRGEELVAPALLDVEVLAVLRKRWLADDLTDERLHQAVADLLQFPLDRHDMQAMAWRAYELRNNVTPYDAVYAGLAEVLDCPLLTADQRLARAVGPQCEIRLLESDPDEPSG